MFNKSRHVYQLRMGLTLVWNLESVRKDAIKRARVGYEDLTGTSARRFPADLQEFAGARSR